MSRFENGTLILESRKVRIGGNGCGYDIIVQEMTESEVRHLKEMRYAGFVAGLSLGFLAGALLVLSQFPASI